MNHPALRNPRQLTLYLALWLPAGLLLAVVFGLAAPGPWAETLALVLPLVAVYAFACLSAWYVASGVAAPETPLGRVVASALASSATASLLWLVVGSGWAALLSGFPSFSGASARFSAALGWFFGVGVLLYALALLGHALWAAFERSARAERRALELQVLTREAELRLLKAQLDPHFLFNSLNSLSALIGSDPASARRMCHLLAGFFRKSLGLGARELIPLAEEIYLAETYLAIEEVRFGSRLQVVMDVAEGTQTLAVPPLLLQPLIENAVHHGIAPRLDGGEIRVTARRLGPTVQVEVANPCDPERPSRRGTGVGLSNVRDRLAALYGAEGSLTVDAAPERFVVRLAWPARAAPAGAGLGPAPEATA